MWLSRLGNVKCDDRHVALLKLLMRYRSVLDTNGSITICLDMNYNLRKLFGSAKNNQLKAIFGSPDVA